jgi:hypothetical protein
VQTPAWQVSVCVQELPSEQEVPLATGVNTQAPLTQVSVVHGLPSSQVVTVVIVYAELVVRLPFKSLMRKRMRLAEELLAKVPVLALTVCDAVVRLLPPQLTGMLVSGLTSTPKRRPV